MGKRNRNTRRKRDGPQYRNRNTSAGGDGNPSGEDTNPNQPSTFSKILNATCALVRRYWLQTIESVAVFSFVWGLAYLADPAFVLRYITYIKTGIVWMTSAITYSIGNFNYDMLLLLIIVILLCRCPSVFIKLLTSRYTLLGLFSVIAVLGIGQCIVWYANYVIEKREENV